MAIKKFTKKAKYLNNKVTLNGISFDSKKESDRYLELILLSKASKISNFEIQVPFVLAEPVILDGRKKPAIRYFADFVYLDEFNNKVVEDVKSDITRKDKVYRIKKHLMKSIYNIDIKEL